MSNIIVPFKSFSERKVRGTHIKQGAQLYAIKNVELGLFYIWAYTSEENARVMAATIAPKGKGEKAKMMDLHYNWRRYFHQLTPTNSISGFKKVEPVS